MFKISKQVGDRLISHALEESPNECCGLLLGQAGNDYPEITEIREITNIVNSPTRYQMDPQEYVNAWQESERRSLDVIACYHSHTRGANRFSETDRRLALENGWIDFPFVLVVLHDKVNPKILAFNVDSSGKVEEITVELI